MSILTRKVNKGSDEIEVSGKKLRVIAYERKISVREPDQLHITVTGTDLPFGNVPHRFDFMGDEWFVQDMQIQASSRAAVELTMTATNKKFSGLEARVPVPKAAPDPHEQCVPREHYEDLKGLAVMLLNMHHGGSIELNTVELDYLENWQILHTKTDADMNGFLAIPPEVHIES